MKYEKVQLYTSLVVLPGTQIIVVPSISPGIVTELHTLAAGNLLEKNLVYIPKVRRMEERHWFEKGWLQAKDVLKQKLGFNLPDYDPDGVMYRPNPDLSVKKKYQLFGLALFNTIADAVEQLLESPDESCLPLSEILNILRGKGTRLHIPPIAH